MPVAPVPTQVGQVLSNIGIRPFMAVPGPSERAGVFDIYQTVANGDSADTANVFSIAAGNPGGTSALPVIDLYGASVLQTAQGCLYADNAFIEFPSTTAPADIEDILRKAYIVKAIGASNVWRVKKMVDVFKPKILIRSDASAAAVNRADGHEQAPGQRLVPEGHIHFNFTTDRLYLGFLSALSLSAGVTFRWGFYRALVCQTSSQFFNATDPSACASGTVDSQDGAKANLLAQSAVNDKL